MNNDLTGDRRVPNSIQLAAIFLIADAAVAVAGIIQIFGIADASNAGIQVFGTMYRLDTPLFPWVLTSLGSVSVAAAWLAVKLRRFQFVIGVALIWTGLAIAALPVGPGLLIDRLIVVAALVRGRSAFLD